MEPGLMFNLVRLRPDAWRKFVDSQAVLQQKRAPRCLLPSHGPATKFPRPGDDDSHSDL